MKNIKAIRRLIEQGLTEKEARYYVKSISELGYSPEIISLKHTAKEIKDIVDSVDRVLSKVSIKG